MCFSKANELKLPVRFISFSRIKSLAPLLITEFQNKIREDGPLQYKPYFKESFVVTILITDLEGLFTIQKQNDHYWAEVFVDGWQMNCKKGLVYAHDGLRINGIAFPIDEDPKLQSQGRHVMLAFL